MTLTIPQAGVIGGRAADAASMQVAEPETGAMFSQLGEVITQKALKVKADRDDLMERRVQLDMARDMGLARQEVDQISDPTAVGQTWDARSTEIRQKYLDQIEDPVMRDRLGLQFDEMNNRHSLAVGDRAIGLTQSQRGAQWVEQRAAITSEAARADQETFGILLEMGEASIDNRLSAGDLNPEQAATEKQQLRQEVYAARAVQAIQDDPQAFLDTAKGGAFDILGGDRLTDLTLSAEREITRRADAAAKAADQDATKQRAALKKRFGDQAALFGEGLSVTDEAMLTNPTVLAAVEADPELQVAHAQAMAAKSLRDELPNIRQETPARIRAEIAAERAKPKDHPFQAERIKVLEAWATQAEAQWNSDGISAAAAAGLPVPALPELDPANPASLAQGISDRLTFDAWQAKNGYSKGQAVLSTAEAAKFKSVLAPEADVAPKVALAEAVAKGAPPAQSRRVTGMMGADPVFNRVVRIVQETGDRDLATSILAGQQKEKLGTVSLPAKAKRQLIFAEVTGGSLSDDPAREAELFEAASALYAADAAGINPDGDNSINPFKDDPEAQELFRSAVARVSGAKPDRNGQLTIGGLQEVNGGRVVLPKGVAQEAVEDAWEKVDVQLRGGVWDDRYGAWSFAGQPADPLRALKSASIDAGAAPAFGANARAQWQSTRLRRVGESDVYELLTMRNGREVPVPIANDPQGRAFRFRLPKLIEGAQR